jgi:hypothetical protein
MSFIAQTSETTRKKPHTNRLPTTGFEREGERAAIMPDLAPPFNPIPSKRAGHPARRDGS